MEEYQPYVPIKECTSLPEGWNEDAPSGMEMARLAQEGHSFDFLLNKEEDIYSRDGLQCTRRPNCG